MLDTKGAVFHSLHALEVGVLEVAGEGRGVYSHWTSTYPCVIHGNAGGRDELARVTGLLGEWLRGG